MDLPKSQVLTSEWKTGRIREDASGDSEDGEEEKDDDDDFRLQTLTRKLRTGWIQISLYMIYLSPRYQTGYALLRPCCLLYIIGLHAVFCGDADLNEWLNPDAAAASEWNTAVQSRRLPNVECVMTSASSMFRALRAALSYELRVHPLRHQQTA